MLRAYLGGRRHELPHDDDVGLGRDVLPPVRLDHGQDRLHAGIVLGPKLNDTGGDGRVGGGGRR